MQRVINPYNFISFGTDIKKKKKSRENTYRENNQLKSGWLDVKLTPSTPLIIPDGAHPVYIDPKSGKEEKNPNDQTKKNCHKKYDFMNRLDENGCKQYYIPGSSLRGMIRSVYEAATNSCVPFLLADKKKPISQRVPLYAALKKRGLLSCEIIGDNKVWKLYSADATIETVKIVENKQITIDRYGKEKVSYSYKLFSEDGTEITTPTGTLIDGKGIIQYNIPVDISKDYHIAYLSKRDLVHEWDCNDNEPYYMLRSVLFRDNVKGNQINRNAKPAKDLLTSLENAHRDGGMVPVYYMNIIRRHEDHDEELVYLSNSSAGRIAQKRKWADIIGDHGPCNGKNLCPACLLFGALGNEYGLKSHVRFTDALPEEGSGIPLKDRTLDVLGEPRTSAFEFYLERPDGASYWNFDFYGKTEKDRNGISHTRYYDMEKARPRGRKMYWHGKPYTESAVTKLNTTMASAEGTSFTFRVYFDEISDSQLNSLIWVLTLGDNDGKSPYQHKLGHAKPLGYGSVKLIITGGSIRKIVTDTDQIRLSIEPLNINRILNEINSRLKSDKDEYLEAALVNDILKMSDIHAAGDVPVAYPRGEDQKIFSWFSENRIRSDEVLHLPRPSDEDISIPSAIKKPRKQYNPSQKGTYPKKTCYKEGEQAVGKIISVSDSVMKISLENGDPREKYVYFKNTFPPVKYGKMEESFPIGTVVTVEYRGYDKKIKKEQWYVTSTVK